jgi:hypothetical protein
MNELRSKHVHANPRNIEREIVLDGEPSGPSAKEQKIEEADE